MDGGKYDALLGLDEHVSSDENEFQHLGFDSSADDLGEDSTAESPGEMHPPGKMRPMPPKREADLSSLLSIGEKNDVTSLVARVTDGMQKQIIQVFDSTGMDHSAPSTRAIFWSKLPSHLRDLSLNSLAPSGAAAPRGPVAHVGDKRSGNTNALRNKENERFAQGISGNRGKDRHVNIASATVWNEEKEALGPHLQELKKETLLHFKKWQASVQKRISDISVRRTGDYHNSPSSFNGGPNQRNRQKTQQAAVRVNAEIDQAFVDLTQPTSTPLTALPVEKRELLLHCLLLMVLSLEHYSAYSRVLLLNIASSLRLPLNVLTTDEVRVAKSLSQFAKDIPADEMAQKRIEESKSAKKWKIGLASFASAAVIGMTGGLATPLVAAGIGTILGGMGLGGSATASLLGTISENNFLVGALFGAFGARATGKFMEQYSKDTQDFGFKSLRGSLGEDEIEIGKIGHEHRRLRVVLGISGWLTNESDFVNPWRALGHQNEVYAVRWELDTLKKMGNSLQTLARSAAWSLAKKEITARAIHSSLASGQWPAPLLRISKIVDNPWNVGMVRADKAGAVLADIIMNRVQGERGVTLVGYSLGARLIYACLMSLAERRAFGLVENVVLLGTPAPSEARVWCAMKSVVAGRLVNVYSENDYILGFLYRTSTIQYGVAGLQPVEGIEAVENMDVSDKISSHLRYQYLVGSILSHINWEDIDKDQVLKAEGTMHLIEERNRERERKRHDMVLGPGKPELGVIQTRSRKTKGKKK